jgi:hypothetical protein
MDSVALPQNKKFVYAITMVVMMLLLGATCAFEEGIAFLDTPYTSFMSLAEFYLAFSVVVFLAVISIFLAVRFFHVRINWWFLGVVGILFIGDLIAVLSFPTEVSSVLDPTMVYSVDYVIRMEFISYWFVFCLVLYLVLAVFPKCVVSSRSWDWIFIIGILVAIVAVFFSYAHDAEAYKGIFDPDNAALTDSYYVVSFTNNRNTYGALLFIGIMCCLFLHTVRPHFWDIPLAFFFFGNLFLVLSKTSILCSSAFLVIWLVWYYIVTVRKHPVVDNVVLGVVVLTVLVVVFLWFVGALNGIAPIKGIFDKVGKAFSDPDLFEIPSRKRDWNLALDAWAMSPLTPWFGLGDWNFSYYIGFCRPSVGGWPIYYAHSGFFDIMGRLGILGVLVYLGLIAYAGVLIVRGFARHHKAAFVSLLFLLFMFLHGLVENTAFLDGTTKDLSFLLGIFLPLLTDDYQDRHPEIQATFARDFACPTFVFPKIVWTPLTICKFMYLLTAPLFILFGGLSHSFNLFFGWDYFDNVWFLSAFGLVFFFFPIIVYEFCNIWNEFRHKRALLILGLGIVFSLSTLLVACLLKTWIGLFVSLLILVGILTLGFVFSKKDWQKIHDICNLAGLYLLIVFVALLVDLEFSYLYFEVNLEFFAFVCLLLLNLFFYSGVVIFPPLATYLAAPFGLWANYFETRLFRRMYRHNFRIEKKALKRFGRKPEVQ